MPQIITDIFTNPTVSAVLSLLGIALTIVFGVLSLVILKRKRPSFIRFFNNYVYQDKNVIDGLEYRYRGEAVSVLSKTEIYFWNGGNGTVRSGDLLGDNPLGLKIQDGVNVYEVQYGTTRNMKRTFKINFDRDDGLMAVSFDSMQKGEGFYALVLHSGLSADSVDVTGGIDGAKIKNCGENYNLTKDMAKETQPRAKSFFKDFWTGNFITALIMLAFFWAGAAWTTFIPVTGSYGEVISLSEAIANGDPVFFHDLLFDGGVISFREAIVRQLTAGFLFIVIIFTPIFFIWLFIVLSKRVPKNLLSAASDVQNLITLDLSSFPAIEDPADGIPPEDKPPEA